MQKILHILLLTGLMGTMVVSCTKEPLPELPENNDPYYTLKGQLNGEEIDLAVGNDNVSISHGKGNMNGIDTYYGEIHAPLSNLIFRVEILEPQLIDEPLEIIPNTIDLLHHEQSCIGLDFGAFGGSQMNFILIENKDGVLVPSSSMTFDEFGIYDVDFQFADYGLETFTIPVHYGFEKTDLNADFNCTAAGDSLLIEPLTTAGSHTWYINDKLVGEEMTFIGNFGNGIYKIRHDVVDGNNNVASYTTLIRIKADEFYWQMNMNYCDATLPINNFGKVKLSLKKDGVWYCSDTSIGIADESFVTSNIDYVVTSDYKPSKAIFNMVLKAKLYSSDKSSFIELNEIGGRFKVGLE